MHHCHLGTSEQPPQGDFLMEKTVWLEEQDQSLLCKIFSRQKMNGEYCDSEIES